MKKRWLSLLLAAAMACSMIPAAFAADTKAEDAANTLYDLGLFSGVGTNPDGTPIYDLDRAPTRQEAVTMLVGLLGKKEEALSGTWDIPFTDVAGWAEPFIGYAYANGLTSGTSETTFGGNDLVSAAQYLTFVLKTLGYEAGKDFQWDRAWEFSDKIGLTDGRYSDSTKSFSRGDVARISCDALSVPVKNTNERLIQQLAEDGTVDPDRATRHGLDACGWLNEVKVQSDIRTFTVYAYMNYTGYDDNNGFEITGVRKQLRDELDSMNLSLSKPNYFAEHNLGAEYYVAALGRMGASPDFRYLETNSLDSSLMDLPEQLSEFYKLADIPALYEKYRPYYEECQAAYLYALDGVVKMIDIFSLENTQIPRKFAIEPNPIGAQGHTIGFGNRESFYGHGVLRLWHGKPAAQSNRYSVTFVYAYVGVVSDIVAHLSKQINGLAEYYQCQPGEQWLNTVQEYLSRAMAVYVLDGIEMENVISRKAPASELAYYFYDRLSEFEDFDGDLNQFIQMLLEEHPKVH